MKFNFYKNEIKSTHSLARVLGCVVAFSFILAPLQNVFAERMTSGNYTLQSDSVNFEGGRSTSGSYSLEAAAGEIGTGDSSSANNKVHAGFEQTEPVVTPVTPTPTTPSTPTGSSGSIPTPVNVINFKATPLTKSIGLSWSYPEGANIAGVRIVRSDKFFPSDISDGEIIFEGNGNSVIDNDVKVGVRYYYALFAQNAHGDYSSGVLAQARISLASDTEPPVKPGDIFENIPPSPNLDATISKLSLLDFDFIQSGRKIQSTAGTIPVDGKLNLTIQLAYNKVPEILKTIAITLTDPEDSTRVFSFLLRVNKDKTAYEATIAPLGRSGDYKLDAIILDYKNQGLKRLNGNLHSLMLADAQNIFGDGDRSPLSLMIIFLVIAFLAVIIFIILERRKKQRNEMTKKVLWGILLLLVTVANTVIYIPTLTSTAHAAINKEINYQGKLANSSDDIVSDGTYAMEFNLYTVASGGSPIWTESLTGGNEVQVTNGLFSVLLGQVSSLAAVDFNQTLYLGVNIEGDGEMTPRKKIGAVPSAFVADTLDGLDSTQFLRSDTTNASGIFTDITVTNATITNASTTDITVAGKFYDSTGSAGNNGQVLKISGGLPVWGTDLSGGGGGGSEINWTYFNGSGTYLSTTTNQVLIGDVATTSNQKLEVIGGAYLSGNVGIGTTSPYAKLSVNGRGVFNQDVRANYFTATSTSVASTFPYASSTAITVSGTASTSNLVVSNTANIAAASIGTLNGVLYGTNGSVGTIATSTLNIALSDTTGTLAVNRGGTGLTSYTLGDLLYANGTGSLAGTSTANLKNTLGLNNVENTALSTWAGSTNLTTLGTILTGVWNGTAIGDAYLTKSGNWTGTFDGQEGSYYLDARNLTNFGTPFYSFFSATTTDALAQGSTNKYYSDTLVNAYIHASSTIPKTYTANIYSALQTFGNNISFGGAQLNAGALSYGNLLTYNGSNWVNTATSSLNISLSDTTGTLPVSKGGTGQTSFGQGWLNSDGATLTSSTSPTVNYITATSTTATSTFAGNISVGGRVGIGSISSIYQAAAGLIVTSPYLRTENTFVVGTTTLGGNSRLIIGNPDTPDPRYWDFNSNTGVTYNDDDGRTLFSISTDGSLSTGVNVGGNMSSRISTNSTGLGFFGATPVAKPSSTTDLRQALINLGLYTTGGASPLNLNGGTLTAGAATIGTLSGLLYGTNGSVGTIATSSLGLATFGYLFPSNATSTLLSFNGGLTSYASTTIGAGGQTTGLTINGGATTTGNAYFAGNVGVGTTTTNAAKFTIQGPASFASRLLYVYGQTASNSSDITSIESGGAYVFNAPGHSLYGVKSSPTTNNAGGSWAEATDNYAFYANPSGGVIDWGIYTTGEDKNYFSGLVGIGTTSPWRALSVNGSSDLGNNALAGYFTATTSTASTFPYASTTMLSATTASTTNLIISGIPNCSSSSALTTNASGLVACGAILGSGGGAYPFSLAGNATSTLTQFNGGLTSYASTTIGAGTQATGLTISGGATTTGNLIVQGTGTSTFAGGLNIGNGSLVYDFTSKSISIGSPTQSLGGPGGGVNIIGQAGNAGGYAGGQVSITGGQSSTAIDGGNVVINGGIGGGFGAIDGNILLANLRGNVGIGTTSPLYKLSVEGSSSLGNRAIAGYFTATTSTASTFPYASTTMLSATTASTTNLIVSSLGGTTQCLQANSAGVITGTGSSCAGVGATYDWTQQTNIYSVNSLTPTSTLPLWIKSTATSTFAGGIESWDKIGAPYFVATSTSIASTFRYASTTALTVSGVNGLTVGTLNGVLYGTNGAVGTVATSTLNIALSDTTGILAINRGGTGTSTAPTYGKVLLGNALGTYDLVATSSLGLGSGFGSVTSVDASGGSTGLTFTGGPVTTTGTLTLSGILAVTNGGTGWANINSGYIPFGNGASALGTSSSFFWDNTNARLGIGTTSPYAKLSVAGNVVAANFIATSTTATSTFAGSVNIGNGALSYDSSTGTTSISYLEAGNMSFAADSGVISWIDLPVTSASANGVVNSYSAGFNGSSLLTVYGVSNGSGSVINQAIGIGTTSPNWKLSVNGDGSFDGFARASYFTATSTRASTFPYASTTALTVSGVNGLTLGTLNGPLQANNGVVSATTSIGVLYGGTGLTSTPSYGNLLVGNSSGGYTLTATSSLGLATFGYLFPSNATSTLLSFNGGLTSYASTTIGAGGQTTGLTINGGATTTGNAYFAGNVGVGTTTPYAKLSVVGQVVGEYFTATSTTATSTFRGNVTVGSTNLFASGSSLAGGIAATALGGERISASNGSIAWGNLSSGSTITASGQGSFAFGKPREGDITASGQGSFAGGSFGNGAADGSVTSSGQASFAFGRNVSATADYATAFGSGFSNGQANSFQVGYSTTGAVVVPTLTVNATGVGIGTTSPFYKLSVEGSSSLGNQAIAGYFTATTSTASTFPYASTTMLSATTASTTNLIVSGITNCSSTSALTTNASGVVACGAISTGVAYPFGLAGNATSTLTQFNGGLTSYASTTIGAGGQTTGLTINGGATTTGNAYFAGNVGVGTTTPFATLSVVGKNTDSTAFAVYGADALDIGGGVLLQAGTGDTKGGSIEAYAGNKNSADANGGDIKLKAGFGGVNGVSGKVYIDGGSMTAFGGSTSGGDILLSTVNSGNVGIGTTSPYAKLSVVGQVVGAYFTATTSTASTFPYASTTMLSATTASTTNLIVSGITGSTQCLQANASGVISGTGSACGAGGGGAAFAWTPGTNYGVAVNSTSTPIWFQNGLMASTTAYLTYASTTALTVAGNAYFPGNGIWNSSGFVGIGTTSPYAALSVVGASGVVADKYYATSTTATSTFAGGLDVGGGNLVYDFATGVTSIGSLESGNFSFDTDAGLVSWTDLPISSAPANTPQGYTAYLGGNAAIKVYGTSNGSGALNMFNVGIGSSTAPSSKFSVFGAGTGTGQLFGLVNSASTTVARVLDNGTSYFLGNVGVGTTSPYAPLSVLGQVVASYFTATTSTASTFPYASTTMVSATTASTTNLIISGLPSCSSTSALTTNSAGVVSCGAISGGSGAAFAWTPGTNYGTAVNSTTTPIWFQNGLMASSTAYLTYATTTAITVSGNAYFPGSGIWNSSGFLGIGTTSPYAALSVVGASGVVADKYYATSTTATSTFAGGLDVGAGNLMYDLSTGITSASAFQTGNLNFDTDAGLVSWADLPLSGASSGTIEGYTASLNGSSTISIYGVSAGSGWLQPDYPRVAIGTTTAPSSKLHVFSNGTGTGGTFELTNNASTSLVKVLDNGSFGIGTTSPFATLAVNPVAGVASNQFVVGSSTATSFIIKNNGAVGIGSTTPWRTLDVNGTVALNNLTSSATGNALCITATKEVTDAGGGTCTPSSARFKENITPMNAGFAVDTLSKLAVVDFDYKEKQEFETNHSYGMIAEDVEKIDKNLVDYGYDGKPLSLHFEKITGLLVQAVQEQQVQIKGLASTTSGLSTATDSATSNIDLLTSNVNSTFESIASNLASTSQTTKTLASALDTTNATVSGLTDSITGLTNSIASTNASTSALTLRISSLEDQMSALASSTDVIVKALASSTADLIASSTAQTLASSTSFIASVFESIKELLATTVTKIKGVFVGELHVEEKLCVEDVCINKDQLKALLINAGGTSSTTPSVNVPAQNNQNTQPTPPTPAPDVIITPESAPASSTPSIASSTPSESSNPTPAVSPEVAPTPAPESQPAPAPAPEPAPVPAAESAPAPAPAPAE